MPLPSRCGVSSGCPSHWWWRSPLACLSWLRQASQRPSRVRGCSSLRPRDAGQPCHSPSVLLAIGPSRRRDCHSADAPSPPLLKYLPKGEGGGQNDSLTDGHLPPPALQLCRRLVRLEHPLTERAAQPMTCVTTATTGYPGHRRRRVHLAARCWADLGIRTRARLAVGETVIPPHTPLPSAGASMWMERGCQQNDSLVNGQARRHDRRGGL